MGTVRKVNDDYYIEFFARGLKYQQKAGKDLAAAKKMLKEVEAKIAQGETGTIVRDVAVDIFFQDFLEQAQDQHTARSVSRYESLAEHFQEFLKRKFVKIKNLSQVIPSVLEEYKKELVHETRLRGRKLKPRFINFTLLLLRDIFEYARKLGYLNDNPTLHVQWTTASNVKTPPYLTEGEIKGVLSHADEKLSCIIECMLHTGARAGEVCRFTWGDVDWTENRLKITTANAVRFVPMNPRLIEMFEKLKNEKGESEIIFYDEQNRALKEKSLMQRLDQAFDRLEENKKGAAQILRHTFARRLLVKNFSLIGLYKILGLSDVAKVMVFTPFLNEQGGDVLTPSPLGV